MTGLRVYLRHARAINDAGGRPLCAAGIRAWCTQHGIDLRELSRAGIPADRIAAIPDHYARQALRIAREEAERG